MSGGAPVKRWTAKRKAVVIDILKGKTTPAEVARQHDPTVAEVECWIQEAERNMQNGSRTTTQERGLSIRKGEVDPILRTTGSG